jgi:hypothetical protein
MDIITACPGRDGHNIEAAWIARVLALARQKNQRTVNQFPAFTRRYLFYSFAVLAVAPVLHLNKHQRFGIEHHQVDFATATTKITLNEIESV